MHNMLVKKNITWREAKRMAKNGVWWRSMDDTRGFLAGARIRMCHTNFADYNITNAVKHDTLRHEKPKEIK